ncbi:ParB/RepB/Spo0J family partition protein [Salinarimonas rosea]|uniref:ParB/RepB/Spo0J family partition protein n=1 Tax=Salinarimonas rosea TaxID=552063 RepID=UPI000404AFE1|nr:ParB/RepB/Spo0J family partition protein [Salinarimonas rosea]
MRTISTEGLTIDLPPTEHGPAPMLQWIRIADLVVDDGYQRAIRGEGVRNVRKIATNFRWSRFAPVVVAPVPGGKFAIIDGQHRTTAAALLGIESVPCQVVIADAREQADAFAAINGAVTKMTPMALHHASVAAGDPEALAVDEACRCAGVHILRYPVDAAMQKPGQTMAVATLACALKTHGRDVLVTALQCITQTSNGEEPGLITSGLVKAICDVLSVRRDWLDAGERLLQAFDDIDLSDLVDQARLAPKPKGVSRTMEITRRLRLELSRSLDLRAAA